MSDRSKAVTMTAHMGRVWVGCEHDRQSWMPHLCFDCFEEAILTAAQKVGDTALGKTRQEADRGEG